MNIRKAGVVGCGAMGSGIAQVIAQSGYTTVVSEINDQLLQRGLNGIKANLARSVEKGKLSKQDEEAILARLKGTTSLQDFADCDIVVEAAIEILPEKKKLFASLDQICPPHAILATNTSSLSVTDIAVATKRPKQVAGIHFFNPAPVMKLVEVVKTLVSSDETISTARSFAQSLGKTVVSASDTPGFIVNRLLTPFVLEAVRLYEAGIATREDIDQGIVLGANHPMGPLTLADMVGLDIFYNIANSIYDETKDVKFAPPVLLRRMVSAGQLGRKTGKGFYDYK